MKKGYEEDESFPRSSTKFLGR